MKDFFSPLFIGAMVATLIGTIFSVPFSSGQWLLHYTIARLTKLRTFSPLFIAMVATATMYKAFSPLFIGAMVATMWTRDCYSFSPLFINGCYEITFSPLFIGAMVATLNLDAFSPLFMQMDSSDLSVPFSSGQWLLLGTDYIGSHHGDFQSPFHRGNGCYICVLLRMVFQSPFHGC